MIDITSYLLGKEAGGGGGGGSPEDVAAAYNACSDKGATLPEEQTLANLADCIETIPGQTIIPPEAGTLTGISFQSLPTKLTYTEGETIDLTGCVVLGSYSSGNIYDVTNNCTYTVNTPLTYTDTQVVVSLETFTLSIPITVNGIPVEAPSTVYSLYHFESNLRDEVSGTNASGTYSQRDGKFGNGDYNSSTLFRFPVNTASYQTTNPLTIEWWARTESQSSSSNLVMTLNYRYGTNNANEQCIADIRPGTTQASYIYLYTGTGGWTTSVTNLNLIPANTDWREYHHFAIVFNGLGYARVFCDGVPITESPVNNSGSAKVPNGIMAFSSNFRIDELMTCNEMKYWDRFTPNHAPYYIAE